MAPDRNYLTYHTNTPGKNIGHLLCGEYEAIDNFLVMETMKH